MKKLIQIIALMISTWGVGMPTSQTYAQSLEDNKNYRWGEVLSSTNLNNYRKIELWKLQFHNKEFGWIDTDELYLVQLTKRKFEEATTVNIPKIILTVTGHTSTLKTLDLDQDGTEEVLFAYHAGANQTILRVFLQTDTGIIEAKGPVVASNMASIEFRKSSHGYDIIFKNSVNDKGIRKNKKSIIIFKCDTLLSISEGKK